MEAGDILIIEKPKRKSPTPKKKDGEERNIIIYKIEIPGTNFLYVGHTESYKQRLDNHRTACKANLDPDSRSQNKNCPLYIEINKQGGWTKVVMSPVEEFVSKNKIQSRIREQYWIDKIQVARRDAVLMNGCPAYVSPEQKAEHSKEKRVKYVAENREKVKAKEAEYRAEHREEIIAKKAIYQAEHREEISARMAKYREEHREELNAKNLEHNSKKMTCACGVEVSVGHKSRHLKSAKHIKWEQAKDQEFVDRLEKEMDKIIENNM
jgi:hypothetical protein